MKIITIRTFGEFTLEADGIVLSDSGTRVKKAWSLLAYLVCRLSMMPCASGCRRILASSPRRKPGRATG